MLTEQRQEEILTLVNSRGSITVAELVSALGISESTARRDITTLDRLGKLEKVFGGAISLREMKIITSEPTVAQKLDLYKDEKQAIAAYAATLISPEDFIYLDAGTSTLALAECLPKDLDITIVTNGVAHAQLLASSGMHVILIGGELKSTTEAVIGGTAILMLQNYHFTKGFFGTNGISRQAGFTTPDANEAMTKKTALNRCRYAYILSDSSKFDVITSVSFASLGKAKIITERIPEAYKNLGDACITVL